MHASLSDDQVSSCILFAAHHTLSEHQLSRTEAVLRFPHAFLSAILQRRHFSHWLLYDFTLAPAPLSQGEVRDPLVTVMVSVVFSNRRITAENT